MSDIAIRVENLSKLYRIGGPQARYKTIRESLTEAVQAPFRRLSSVIRGQSSTVSNETIWALKDVSFEVKRGEVVGIIGRNGAGKTTLLKLLCRITEPTSGYAELHGRVGSLLEVGTGFHPELTGRENIYLNGAILGMRKREIDRKFDEIVAFAEIDKFMDTPVKRYSSGMYVRLAFAVAAHLEPEILLVDEVLSVGDAAFQKKCLGKMGDVAREGRTVLFVSHNMGAVQRLCMKSILLDNGQIAAQGRTTRVIEQYLASGMREFAHLALEEIPRERDLGTRARISQCLIRDSRGQPSNSFAFGEPFMIEIACRVFKSVEEVSFLVGIDSIYQERIVTITSLEARRTFSADAGTVVKGCLKVDNLFLKPGIYSITLGLFSTNLGIDRVPNVAQIEIVDVSFTPERPHVSQVTVGVIQLPDPKWKIE